MLRVLVVIFFTILYGGMSMASGTMPNFTFESIDGGKIDLAKFKGSTVLIANTASKCGFTGQYEGLQELYDEHKENGLVVLGIPSADFRQEYKENGAVKEFCEVNFGINFPLTEITKVTGENAHPFYLWLNKKHNYRPRWNFGKILIGTDGSLIDTFGTAVSPSSNKLKKAIKNAMNK